MFKQWWLAKKNERRRSPARATAVKERGLEIPREFAEAMVQHAREEDPNECCGLLAGQDGRVTQHYRITNAEKSPYRYSMDGKELLAAYNEIEEKGWEIQVIYHSHTHSPAYPSNTDIRLATWPDAYYLLVSLMDRENPDIRLFRIIDGVVTEEQVVVTDEGETRGSQAPD